MKREKKFFTVRKKLIAAASSLGVAMIMVVSCTYAWFTLSTAPEVTGISTQIGANGNLEMALLPSNGNPNSISSGIVGAGADATMTNTYWGNLVNLSDASYGLNEINLKPSRLNETAGNVTGYNGGSILKTPTTSVDGRPNMLSDNTFSAIKSAEGFKTSDTQQYGVRAIGTANGKSVQEVAFLNAKSAIASNKTAAKSAAQTAISTQGNAIANIAVKHGLGGGTDTYTETDVQNIKDFAAALKTSFVKIDAAFRQAVVAKATTLDTVAFTVAKTQIENTTNPLSTLTIEGFTLPEYVATYAATVEQNMTKLQDIVDATFDKTGVDGNYSWNDLSTHFNTLINADDIRINGMTVSEAKNNLGSLLKGITVSTPTGSGVMADVADYVGNYSASVTIEDLMYNGQLIGDVPATLAATTTVNPTYLDLAAAAVDSITPVGQTGEAVLTDLYGYALDFAFRTNAANSNLMLQTAEAQRIYSDSANSLTQGGGTYFEFSTSDASMLSGDAQKLVKLMGALRVVFTDGTGKIVAIGATSRTINETTTTFVKGTDYTVNGTTVKAYISLYNYTCNEGVITLNSKMDAADQKLIALQANTATRLSTIVYLDGDNVDNSMVSAFDTITGSLNLQFASDAELVPMNDSDLMGTITYTEYTYSEATYYKGSNDVWYTKSGNNYVKVTDTALIANLNSSATPKSNP